MATTMLRTYAVYEALKVFTYVGGFLLLAGVVIGGRFLYSFVINNGPTGHVQSLILAAILLIVGFQVMMIGLVADLLSANRRLIDETLLRVRRMELSPLFASAAREGFWSRSSDVSVARRSRCSPARRRTPTDSQPI